VKPTYPDESPKKLPQYSCQSTSMSTRNYYPGINIYTQFGDLRPSQMLTLFSQFRQWPEYGESSFLASLENALLKLETANDEQNLEDGVTLPEEDDAEADVNMLVFGAVGSYPFFKHLINSLIFQTSLFNLGRCEMILAIPPPIYIVNTPNVLLRIVSITNLLLSAPYLQQ